MIFFLKKMFTLNMLILPESSERKYFSVQIAIFSKFAFHFCKAFFCKLHHGIFFFYKMHCFKWRRRKVANIYVQGLYIGLHR